MIAAERRKFPHRSQLLSLQEVFVGSGKQLPIVLKVKSLGWVSLGVTCHPLLLAGRSRVSTGSGATPSEQFGGGYPNWESKGS